jgi:hypothetical protein
MKRLTIMCIGLSILVMTGLLALPVIAQGGGSQDNKQVVIIQTDGTLVPDSFILSKTGKNGLPKRAKWINETGHDVYITFDNSPFTGRSFKVSKTGGTAESGDIRPDAKPTDQQTKYVYKVNADDPEVIIRN